METHRQTAANNEGVTYGCLTELWFVVESVRHTSHASQNRVRVSDLDMNADAGYAAQSQRASLLIVFTS